MRRYRDDVRLNIRQKEPHGFSGLGLASILTALGAGLLLMLVLFIAVIFAANQQGQQVNDNDPMTILVGALFLLGVGANLIGLVLGIVGFFQRERSIVMPIIGTVLNAAIMIGILFVVCLGIVAG